MNVNALFVVGFLGVSLAATAASAPPGRTDYNGVSHTAPEGREWRISQYYVHQVLLFPHPQVIRVPRPYIGFADGAIHGSPGCGEFTGTYRRSGDVLTIEAKWSDDAGTPCNEDEKQDAARMLEALGNVRQIGNPPSYWHDDALVLNNDKGQIQVTLSPRQVGNDLSDLHDAYWHLGQLNGSQSDLSRVVINIREDDVSFSTSTCFLAFPFEYEMAGLKFSPAWSRDCAGESSKSGQDWQVAKLFESALHSINSYQQAQGMLRFFDKGQHLIMVLAPIRSTSIENRVWRIEKYRNTGAQPTDRNGLIDAESPATITFVNGRVDGSPGCGAWAGTYKLSNDQLSLDAGAFLAGLCSGYAEAQSRLVEKAFRGELRIAQSEDHILLRDETGQAQLLLAAY